MTDDLHRPDSPARPGSATDLGHLHPDRLRPGGTGVFAHEDTGVHAADGTTRYPAGYVGVLHDGDPGWPVFGCTRQVATRIQACLRRLRDAEHARLAAAGITGDLAALTAHLGEQIAALDPARATDEEEAVIDGSAEWIAVDPAACDRIVGVLPPPGRHQRYVVLPHTGLRVPDGRLRARPPWPGARRAGVPAALLAHDDRLIGLLEHRAGVWTMVLPLDPGFVGRDLAGWIGGCRRDGRPVGEAEVFDALVAEHDLDRAVARAAVEGGTVARLVDHGDGTVLALRPVWPVPRHWCAQVRAHAQLAAQPGLPAGRWELWTASGWLDLTPPGHAAQSEVGEDRGPVSPMRVFAHVIADALLDGLTRDELVDLAAGKGILLAPWMTEPEIRAAVRDDLARGARDAGVPVDDLPHLTADQGLELGRILTTTPDQHATDQTPPTSP